MKKATALLLSISFFFSTIIMPYSNFDDTFSLCSIYQESQGKDNDINIGEFILNKLLVIGQWFDEGDDDNIIPKNHQPEPMQAQVLQSGSLFCVRIFVAEQNEKSVLEKPTCLFKENKFSFDFHASIFRPPAGIS